MGDINERLSWVSSESTKKVIIKNKVDLFLRPPVGHIGTLEFDKIGKWKYPRKFLQLFLEVFLWLHTETVWWHHRRSTDRNLQDEIVKIGYEYAKPLVEEWAKENGY